MKKKALIKRMLNWHGNAQTTLLFVYHMHQETSSTLVNKLVMHVSQASLTSLARLVEPAWLV